MSYSGFSVAWTGAGQDGAAFVPFNLVSPTNNACTPQLQGEVFVLSDIRQGWVRGLTYSILCDRLAEGHHE